MQSFKVGKNEAGQRLDKLLMKKMNKAPKSFIYKMLRKKNITLNSSKAMGSEILNQNDEIKMFLSDQTIEKFTERADIRSVQKSFDVIYEDEYIQVEIYTLGHFIAMNFVFHSEIVKDKIVHVYDKLDEIKVLTKLGNLSVSQITSTSDPTKNIFIQKDIKGFEENSFYIIKPNEYKCWHRAMAWYDVAEFKAKIEEAELKDLNNRSNE